MCRAARIRTTSRRAGGTSGTRRRPRARSAFSIRRPARSSSSARQGAAPHGVIVGPDGAAWVTEAGRTRSRASIRDQRGQAVSAAEGFRERQSQHRGLRPRGVLWFTGQNGVYGRVDPATGKVEAWKAPKGVGPYGITTTPNGDVQLSLGGFTEAEASFQTALDCSEPSSLSEVIILENIAHIKFLQQDFEGCRSVLCHLEHLTDCHQDVKRAHYSRWALQTKIRLLLYEGKTSEARRISEDLEILAREAPRARVSAASQLLSAETFLASKDPVSAIQRLQAVISSKIPLPPDLYAEMERVTGNALSMSGAVELAHMHLERASRTFDLIGHTFGRKRTTVDIEGVPGSSRVEPALGSTLCLDRVRALFDLRARPELRARGCFIATRARLHAHDQTREMAGGRTDCA